tara:strand:+ start:1088 stop:1534 length:447 start_codon:yes stop_codon:yes gene_type:complete
MSKTLSYKGTIPMGEQERIKLSTPNGKTGYKITKFQVIETRPGHVDVEIIAKIYNKTQLNAVSNTIEFTESDLMAVAWREGTSSKETGDNETVIFDNQVTNQDIYVTMADVAGNTTPGNYYIELETMSLTDLETTKLTLQNIKAINSR